MGARHVSGSFLPKIRVQNWGKALPLLPPACREEKRRSSRLWSCLDGCSGDFCSGFCCVVFLSAGGGEMWLARSVWEDLDTWHDLVESSLGGVCIGNLGRCSRNGLVFGLGLWPVSEIRVYVGILGGARQQHRRERCSSVDSIWKAWASRGESWDVLEPPPKKRGYDSQLKGRAAATEERAGVVCTQKGKEHTLHSLALEKKD
ncbi:hypothetical protein LR48_Vigan03g106800 [Vigna angularis]|uniref:Uncharacterized protein n=1 Tax=Phaseolus angularis TaxID=3914 RepID=A0A0L9U4I1_PHAAN|nr:hypothetical protein LR48_Vigan03g106800 [Vigna angularis]